MVVKEACVTSVREFCAGSAPTLCRVALPVAAKWALWCVVDACNFQIHLQVVLSHCAHKAFHAGVKFGRASVSDPIRLGTFRKSPKAAEAASPKAFAADHDGNSSTFGGDSLKFDSPSKRGHRARPPVETTGKSIEPVSIVETDKVRAIATCVRFTM